MTLPMQTVRVALIAAALMLLASIVPIARTHAQTYYGQSASVGSSATYGSAAQTATTAIPSQVAGPNSNASTGLGNYWWLVALGVLVLMGVAAWAWAGTAS